MKKMKKMKKIVAWILTMMIVISVVPFTAAAAQVNAGDVTIDTTKPVSLTIHKYEYEGTGGTATGESTDAGTVPEGAKPLSGVTFTVYKVAEIKQGKDGLTYAPVTEIDGGKTDPGTDKKDDKISASEIKGELTSDQIDEIFTTTVLAQLANLKVEGTTGDDGTIVFDDAKLKGQGLYLVKETAYPDKVTGPAGSFLVSLPMTKASGNGWLYDVHVYPKNSTKTVGVTIKKEGKTGNNPATPVSGATFVLQKEQTKADGLGTEWVTQTKDGNGDPIPGVSTEPGKEGYLKMQNDSLTINNLAPGKYRFVEVEAPDSTHIMDGRTTYVFTIASNGTITWEPKENSSSSGNVITVTNHKPSVDKTVEKTDKTEGDAADYTVGDHVPFKIKVEIPANVDKLKTFKLLDEMSQGLTIDTEDENSFEVKYFADAEDKTAALSGMPNPEVNPEKNGWKLEYSDPQKTALKQNNITAIEVSFTATLTKDAVTANPGEAEFNNNTAKLEYSNKILPETEDPGNPNKPKPGDETTTITDEVIVVAFGMELEKAFEGAAPSGVLNAEFDLYRTAKETTPGVYEPGAVELKLENGTTVWAVKVGSYQTDATGKITINTKQTATEQDMAMANGNYYFVETKTADGYNLLKHPIEVKIAYKYEVTTETTTTTTKYDELGQVEGTPTTTTSGKTEVIYKDADGITIPADQAEKLTVKIHVENKKGFTLPATGGMGTLLFSVIGIILMFGGAMLFLHTNKKKHETN